MVEFCIKDTHKIFEGLLLRWFPFITDGHVPEAQKNTLITSRYPVSSYRCEKCSIIWKNIFTSNSELQCNDFVHLLQHVQLFDDITHIWEKDLILTKAIISWVTAHVAYHRSSGTFQREKLKAWCEKSGGSSSETERTCRSRWTGWRGRCAAYPTCSHRRSSPLLAHDSGRSTPEKCTWESQGSVNKTIHAAFLRQKWGIK